MSILMRIVKVNNYNDMSRKAAGIIAAQIVLKPQSVIGLATGSTPLGVYNKLAELNKKGDIDFSQVTTVNLDEYKGLSPNHPQGYRYFMQEKLFSHINILQENTHLPNGLESDTAVECKRYDEVINQCGGIDMQLLGIGHNGHIGFNEPSDYFINDTNCVSLTPRTIEANQRFFNDASEVPKQAYTMGIGTIIRARRIVMVVSGSDKAEIVKKAFTGPISPRIPASILQLHGDFILVGDSEALSLI